MTWTPTIPVTVDTFESLGLAARGPYHAGGGGLSTRDTTPYIALSWSLYHIHSPTPKTLNPKPGNVIYTYIDIYSRPHFL